MLSKLPENIMKNLFNLLFLTSLLSIGAFAQTSMTGIPDSVQNVSLSYSTGNYSITNPLNHDGSTFTNPPTSLNCISNCVSDYLYFYDLDLNIPATATITGVEVIHNRGGCNSGSWVIDSLHLVHNGVVISSSKRDSASTNTIDTLGTNNDLWSAILTPSIINSNGFGLFINTTGNGICTFGQLDVRVKVYYNEGVGVNEAVNDLVIIAFPNPISEFLSIHLGTTCTKVVVSVKDNSGKEILREQVQNVSLFNMSLRSISNGMYFLHVVADGKETVLKIVKED